MNVLTEYLSISTRGNSELLDITEAVSKLLSRSQLVEGNLTVFVVGSTASVTTTEFEPGLERDIPEALNRIAPEGARYHHDDTWQDGNGHSHVRAAVMGPSLTIPFSDRQMLLGTWQQIVLIDFDTQPRQRKVVVQMIGK